MSTDISDYMTSREGFSCPQRRERSDHVTAKCIWCTMESMIDDLDGIIHGYLDDLVDDLFISRR